MRHAAHRALQMVNLPGPAGGQLGRMQDWVKGLSSEREGEYVREDFVPPGWVACCRGCQF